MPSLSHQYNIKIVAFQCHRLRYPYKIDSALALRFFVCYNEAKDPKNRKETPPMKLLNLIALSPATGDTSPQKNIVICVILCLAAVAALVLGFRKPKK